MADIRVYISKYRSPIMGLAMLWVMLYHFGCDIPVISDICGNGFVGVDLFVFLSGFGLYYSMRKFADVSSFYKRRLYRIFPIYILFGIVVSFAISQESIVNFLMKVSTIGFWVGGDSLSYEWFIPSIVSLYLFFPVVYRILEKKRNLIFLIIVLGAYIFAGVGAVCQNFITFPYYLLAYRVAEFLLGSALASSSENFLKTHWALISAVCLIIAVFTELWAPDNNLKMYYFGRSFAMPAVLLIFVVLFKISKSLTAVFAFVGAMTLEIYLAHFCILKAGMPFLQSIHPGLSLIIKLLASLVLGAVSYYAISRPLSQCVRRKVGENKNNSINEDNSSTVHI